jgi:hypothetical protein
MRALDLLLLAVFFRMSCLETRRADVPLRHRRLWRRVVLDRLARTRSTSLGWHAKRRASDHLP